MGTYTIGKLMRFEATRTVRGIEAGNSMTAEVILSADRLTGTGFVTDFGDLFALQEHIDHALDHRDLSDVLADPSDEAIRHHLLACARTHLPQPARSQLADVRLLTGRTAVPAGLAAVHFPATHWLEGLAVGHKCGRRHGHAYAVTLPGPLGGLLPVPDGLTDHIRSTLHHQVLNRILDFNPTSELLAAHLAGWLTAKGLSGSVGYPLAVRVSETESTRPKLPPRLRITEKFRNTVQGEGPSTGRRAAFVRCCCNLTCGWCDTPETWDTRRFNLTTESSWWAVEDLAAWALEGTEPIIVITGGEPLLQPGVVPLAADRSAGAPRVRRPGARPLQVRGQRPGADRGWRR
ncbi:6-carboxytetrahydropterin synthase [Kitasatospora sp. NPDC004745]|uniref:6-carboxytetrahydropterin synthase n=1 Tax=Kitasatospora sp. NPDC004745 TaxID=3364019 RepID=UPI0036A0E0D0